MILPIVAYGDPVLKKVSEPISADYPNLNALIANMWETMYNSNGVGLAAPQIGLNIRLFVIDTAPFAEDYEGENDRYEKPEDQERVKVFKQVFINAEIVDETGEEWGFEEGCLSIPKVREFVDRPEQLTIRYMDENFIQHEETYDGIIARVIQHEYDHIEGILFIDHLSPLRKRSLKSRLEKISKGIVDVDYKMKFPLRRR